MLNQSMNTIDLHAHTFYSDGVLSPEELVGYAASKGIQTLAITDHDTVAGLHEALRSGNEHNVDIIPGVELTAGDGSGEYHILGYYIDWETHAFAEAIECIWNRKRNRTIKILENLTMSGFPITISDVEKNAGCKWHNRRDIARTLVTLGYITSFQEAFTDKLLGSHSPLYVPSPVMPLNDAIQLVLIGHGVPVLAHPGVCPGGAKEAYPVSKAKIAELVEMGLEGLEVFYSRHSQEVVCTYTEIAKDLDLVLTGGSDFHRFAPTHPAIGQTDVPKDAIALLKNRAKETYGE